jgi:hypothetical protein
MTGQDAVLDATALEREAHVRATIVEGEDAPAVVDDKDRTIATVQNDPRSFAFSSLRLPASTNSLLGTSINVPPVVALFERALPIST